MPTRVGSALVAGHVMHRRRDHLPYRFAYRVFWVLLDLEELPGLGSNLKFFSHNRFNIMSFHDKDHGSATGGPLRSWIDGLLAADGIDLAGGSVTLLCMPRVLGFVFNPISVWYCCHRDGSLRAVVCEVHNTFGEKHCYTLHQGGVAMQWPVRAQKTKRLHVSPFIGMEAIYRFRVSEPRESLSLAIREFRGADPLLEAALTGHREPLSDFGILRCAVLYPFLTLKVVAAIHWEALKLWARGGQVFPKPPPPPRETS